VAGRLQSGHLKIDPGQHGRACYRSPPEGGNEWALSL
jgi:hypothetical protein